MFLQHLNNPDGVCGKPRAFSFSRVVQCFFRTFSVRHTARKVRKSRRPTSPPPSFSESRLISILFFRGTHSRSCKLSIKAKNFVPKFSTCTVKFDIAGSSDFQTAGVGDADTLRSGC
jgi:hypothetical protein